MPRFKIQHITKYTYEAHVRDSANQVILFPIKDEYQEVLKHELRVTGQPPIDIYKDYYGNEVGSFTTSGVHTELVIDSVTEVVTKPKVLPDDSRTKEEQWSLLLQARQQVSFIDFLRVEPYDALPELINVAELVDNRDVTPLAAVQRLNDYVFNNFMYIKGVTNVETTLEEIWKLKAGVCQDFAHMLAAMLRIIKIPARYVSGYVCPNKNGMRGGRYPRLG